MRVAKATTPSHRATKSHVGRNSWGVGGWGDAVGPHSRGVAIENSAQRLNPPPSRVSRLAPGRPALAESPRRFDTEPSSRVSRSVLSYIGRSTNPCGCSQPSPITKQTIQPFLPSLRGRVCKGPPTNPSVHRQPSPKANQKTPFWRPPEFHPSRQVAYLMSSCQGSVRWSGSMARAR